MTKHWAGPLAAAVFTLAGCAEESSIPEPRTPVASGVHAETAAVVTPLESAPMSAPAKAPAVDVSLEASTFSRLRPDFVACYKRGRKAAPAMGEGRVTLQAAIASSGQVTCVVPADARGLTGEVTDCLAERLAHEALPAGSGSSLAMTILFDGRDAELSQGTARAAILGEVETSGLADAGDTIRAMVPDLASCVRQGLGTDRRGSGILYVRGRVGRSGEVTCTVATSTQPLPDEVRSCAADRLRQAKFQPPKSGKAVVSIPVTIVGAR